MTRKKPFTGAFITLIIPPLHFTGPMFKKIVMLVNTWEFDTTYSFTVITWLLFGWIITISFHGDVEVINKTVSDIY